MVKIDNRNMKNANRKLIVLFSSAAGILLIGYAALSQCLFDLSNGPCETYPTEGCSDGCIGYTVSPNAQFICSNANCGFNQCTPTNVPTTVTETTYAAKLNTDGTCASCTSVVLSSTQYSDGGSCQIVLVSGVCGCEQLH
jgi:hypothetical protein